MAICVAALARKNELGARAHARVHDKKASKQTDAFSSFLFAYARTRIYFFSSTSNECIGDIVFQACSRRRRRPRRFTSVFLFTYERERERERRKNARGRECQASYRTGESTSTNLDNDAIHSCPRFTYAKKKEERIAPMENSFKKMMGQN